MKGFLKGLGKCIGGITKWGCWCFIWGRIKTIAIIVLFIMYLCK